jgi:pyruvate dehydrogenase E1 component alpha subunit
MNHSSLKDKLISFEKEIAVLYEKKKIKGPIHLSGNNELQLINIFKKIKKNDWVFSGWRNHYHAILKSVDLDFLKKEIIKGKSMNLNCLKKKFFTSSIVGGVLPIALGVAMALKKKKSKSKVWVFIGDMTYETGVFFECYKYSSNFNLPINFVVEDNNMSTNTNTKLVWGKRQKIFSNVYHYNYKRKYPHHGTGKWILF